MDGLKKGLRFGFANSGKFDKHLKEKHHTQFAAFPICMIFLLSALLKAEPSVLSLRTQHRQVEHVPTTTEGKKRDVQKVKQVVTKHFHSLLLHNH